MAYQQTGTEYTRGPAVASPAAVTSVVAAGANPTKAEYDALRDDVLALHATVTALTDALRSSNTLG